VWNAEVIMLRRNRVKLQINLKKSVVFVSVKYLDGCLLGCSAV
jgi:hypothetical protein